MNRKRSRRGGFTLLEVLLVLAILVILAGVVTVAIIATQGEAYEDIARNQVNSFKTPLKMFKLHMGRYPTNDEGLQALITPPSGVTTDKWRGPYIEDVQTIPPDPWGFAYIYQSDGVQYQIFSVGPDGQQGTADDVLPLQQ